MELVKVKKNFQITIPQNFRKLIRLAVGDYVEVEIQGDGLLIRPVKVAQGDREYFFTQEWQKMEREADRDLAEGKVEGPFEEIKDALKTLKNSPK
jgi:AbrB family looped-hinge helix DNA binding protein